MDKANRIFVAGHRGMAGSAMVRALKQKGYDNLIVRDRKQLDLFERNLVREFLADSTPEVVILCAAKVGGITANWNLPAEFIEQNLVISSNVIGESQRAGVKQLLFLSSSCAYPKHSPQPIKEKHLLTGPLEYTNQPFAVAKIAGIEMCWSFNRQYGTRYLAVMSSNLFGVGDNYHPEHSHVLPGLIRRMHEAKQHLAPTVTVWGTGTPQREFLFSDDLADACIFLLSLTDDQSESLYTDSIPPLINIGVGKDHSIHQVAELVRDVVGFQGQIVWDKSKPDGTPRKLLSTSRINDFGWRASTNLKHGIELAYQDFLDRYG